MPRHAFPWLKVILFALFGGTFLIASLYLVLCYVTFDFFGGLRSPVFGWLRSGATVVHVLYFPLLAAALLSVVGKRGSPARRFAAVCICLQAPLAFVIYFFGRRYSAFGWDLVYGPKLQLPTGQLDTYTDSLVCLVPVIWIAVASIMSALPAPDPKKISGSTRFGSFFLAGLAVSLLYAGSARLRMATSGQRVSFPEVLFSVAAHLAIFTGLFLVLEWIRVLANRFRDPGVMQFAIRHLAAVFLLAAVMRKIIFALLGFNDDFADLYGAVFSLAAVTFAGGLKLMIRQVQSSDEKTPVSDQNIPAWVGRSAALAGILGFFYVVAIKSVAIDWEHIISGFTALVVWSLILWFCVKLHPRATSLRRGLLALVSVVAIAGCSSIRAELEQERLSTRFEQYGNYDPSFFVIQQILKPSLHDDQNAAWYAFLQKHANIRALAEVPGPAEGPQATKADRPNIFVFVIDALRRDYVSVYNPAVHFTPQLAKFAEDSVVFQHAYTPYAGSALADGAIWSGQQQIHQSFPAPISKLIRLQQLVDADGYQSFVGFNPPVALLLRGHGNITSLSDGYSGQQQEFGAVINQLEQDLVSRKEPERPVFAFAQTIDVHTLQLAWHQTGARVTPHPGFNDAYASAVENVDQSFGGFIDFLKRQGMYEHSIIVITSDHGESLGEMGRESHVSNVTPEVIQIPLIIHLPQALKKRLTPRTDDTVTLHDITPTLYALLGHRPLVGPEDLIGHSLFVSALSEPAGKPSSHDYLLMSSYLPVFGVLSGDRKSLFMVDATLHRSYFYDLEHDPSALKNQITLPIQDRYEKEIREDLQRIDAFYNLPEDALNR